MDEMMPQGGDVDELSGVATNLFLDLTPEKVLDAVESSGLATRPVCVPGWPAARTAWLGWWTS